MEINLTPEQLASIQTSLTEFSEGCEAIAEAGDKCSNAAAVGALKTLVRGAVVSTHPAVLDAEQDQAESMLALTESIAEFAQTCRHNANVGRAILARLCGDQE